MCGWHDTDQYHPIIWAILFNGRLSSLSGLSGRVVWDRMLGSMLILLCFGFLDDRLFFSLLLRVAHLGDREFHLLSRLLE